MIDDDGLGNRQAQAAVAQAEAIIDAGVQSFAHWLNQRATVPLIQALQAQANDWRATEIARARNDEPRLDEVDGMLDAAALSCGSVSYFSEYI